MSDTVDNGTDFGLVHPADCENCSQPFNTGEFYDELCPNCGYCKECGNETVYEDHDEGCSRY